MKILIEGCKVEKGFFDSERFVTFEYVDGLVKSHVSKELLSGTTLEVDVLGQTDTTLIIRVPGNIAWGESIVEIRRKND